MKIKLIKLLDYCVGKPLCLFLSLFVSNGRTNKDYKKILIIRPGGIGDAVLLYPSLKTLRNSIQDIQIDILAEKRNAGIFKGCKYIGNIYLYDDLKSMGVLGVLNKNYDAVIDTEQWHRLSAVVGFLTRADVRVGFATNERKGLYTNPVEYKQDDYEAVSFLNLVSEITGKKHKFIKDKPFLDIESSSDYKDFRLYRNNHKAVVGIFSGATVTERRWGASNYSLLANKLLDSKIGVVILGGSNDLKDSEYFTRLLHDRDYLDLIGKTAMEETINIISSLDLLVSADSGLMHIAYGVGTKTVSLFGAGIQNKWAPQGTDNHIINKNLSCSPCTSFGYTPKCPIGVKCLAEIDADEVFKTVVDVLPG